MLRAANKDTSTSLPAHFFCALLFALSRPPLSTVRRLPLGEWVCIWEACAEFVSTNWGGEHVSVWAHSISLVAFGGDHGSCDNDRRSVNPVLVSTHIEDAFHEAISSRLMSWRRLIRKDEIAIFAEIWPQEIWHSPIVDDFEDYESEDGLLERLREGLADDSFGITHLLALSGQFYMDHIDSEEGVFTLWASCLCLVSDGSYAWIELALDFTFTDNLLQTRKPYHHRGIELGRLTELMSGPGYVVMAKSLPTLFSHIPDDSDGEMLYLEPGRLVLAIRRRRFPWATLSCHAWRTDNVLPLTRVVTCRIAEDGRGIAEDRRLENYVWYERRIAEDGYAYTHFDFVRWYDDRDHRMQKWCEAHSCCKQELVLALRAGWPGNKSIDR